MKVKKSYKSNLITVSFVALAIGVFFIGPHLITSNTADDAEKLVYKVTKEKKIPLSIRLEIIEQLSDDARYIRENANVTDIKGVKLSAVNWLVVLILLCGVGIPAGLKYWENRGATKQPPASGPG